MANASIAAHTRSCCDMIMIPNSLFLSDFVFITHRLLRFELAFVELLLESLVGLSSTSHITLLKPILDRPNEIMVHVSLFELRTKLVREGRVED